MPPDHSVGGRGVNVRAMLPPWPTRSPNRCWWWSIRARLEVLLLEARRQQPGMLAVGDRLARAGRSRPRGHGAARAPGGDRAHRSARSPTGATSTATRSGRNGAPSMRPTSRTTSSTCSASWSTARPSPPSIRPSTTPSSGCPGRRRWRGPFRRPIARRSASCPGERPSFDMCCTCNYHFHMSTMIQIRNVPDALHRKLKSRAALAGMSLSDYLLQQIRDSGRTADDRGDAGSSGTPVARNAIRRYRRRRALRNAIAGDRRRRLGFARGPFAHPSRRGHRGAAAGWP